MRRRLTPGRLLGIDRSGPPPPETLPGEPLRPWTIPNAIGFARLALIPAFLAVALSSHHGHSVLAAVLFGVAGWSDYADGIAARLTGQYSRLGTLLDPATDRLLVLAGAVVAWRFDLLPRWALVVLAAREALMLVLTRVALRRGIDVQVRQLGRYAVWPILSALFFALLVDGWLPTALLYVGLALTLAATARYLVAGLRARGSGSPAADRVPSSSG